MTASRSRIVAAALIAGGLVIAAAPMSAAAHTGKLYTWMIQEIEPQEEYLTGFADLSQTDASTAFLPVQTDIPQLANGADICANGDAWGSLGGESAPALFTWNHDTGALGATSAPFLTNPEFFPGAFAISSVQVVSADSLADCTKLVIGFYEVEWEEGGDDELLIALSSVDPATGAVTAIVSLSGAAELWRGIATDPVTGVTYLFFRFESDPYYTVLDLSTPAVSEAVPMQGLSEAFEDGGQVLEADFQPDGKLWMLYDSNLTSTDVKLLSFAPGADLAAAVPTTIGSINDDPSAGLFNFAADVLAYDPQLLPATGGTPTGMLAVGAALVLAGAVIAVMRRRPRFP